MKKLPHFTMIAGTGVLLAVLLLGASSAPAGPTVPCTECGMATSLSGRFTARITAGKEIRYFCDIGDLVVHLNRTKAVEFQAQVRDFPTGDWLDARQAFYVRDKTLYQSPMGWGIAAFREPAAAGPPLSFDALRKALP